MQELVHMFPLLLSVVAFNHSAEDLVPFLAHGEYNRRLALILTAAATKPDFVVLGLLPAVYKNEAARRRLHQLNRRDGLSALRELELGYSTRIDLLRSDTFHWKTYMLDHCYVIEYIEGNARKLGECLADSRPEHIERALNSFRNLGIFHLIDASVFSLDDPDNFKFIDFAIEEFLAYW